MTAVDLLYAVTTGPRRRRRLLTLVGLLFAVGLVLLVVFGGLFTDRVLALPPLLPGALGGIIGAGLLAAGLVLWGWCLTLFKGKGVPFDPPSQLVVAGPYAWVRNPMLSGLCVALFGVGVILHSISMVLLWTPAFVLLKRDGVEARRGAGAGTATRRDVQGVQRTGAHAHPSKGPNLGWPAVGRRSSPC